MPDWSTERTLRLVVGSSAAARSSAVSEREQDELVRLFDELRAPILRYLLGFGLAVHDAEETAQEVFLALFQHLRDARPATNLRGWVFRVAHNLGLKRRMSNRRDAEIVADVEPVPAANPEEQYAARQTQERLQSVMRALPELDRRCLTLRAEGSRYREIAEVLEMSLGAVALSLSRSLARMGRTAERCR